MKKYAIIILLTLIVINVYSSNNPFKNLKSNIVKITTSTLEENLFIDAQHGKLNKFTLFDAGIIASGIDKKENMKKYQQRFEGIIKAINNINKFNSLSTLEKGEIILKYLHKNELKKYRANKTTLLDIFDDGNFNCVSSAVLFNAVCEKFGIKTGGTLGNIHAASIFYVDDVKYLVETTNAQGGRGTKGFTKLNSSPYKKHVFNNITLVASIWSNRSAFVHRSRLNEESIINAYKSVRLAPNSKEGVQNLKASFTSYSIVLQKKGKVFDALRLTKELLQFFPEDKMVLNNLITFYIDIVNKYIKKEDFDKAFSTADEVLSKYPNEKQLLSIKKNIYTFKAQSLVKKHSYKNAIKIYDTALKVFPKDRMVLNNVKYVYQQWCLSFTKKKDWTNAIKIIELGLKRFPGDRTFISNRKYCEAKLKKKNK